MQKCLPIKIMSVSLYMTNAKITIMTNHDGQELLALIKQMQNATAEVRSSNKKSITGDVRVKNEKFTLTITVEAKMDGTSVDVRDDIGNHIWGYSRGYVETGTLLELRNEINRIADEQYQREWDEKHRRQELLSDYIRQI